MAKCLGAKKVAARALECARECQVISQVVEDAEAVRAVERFLGEQGSAGHGGGVPGDTARFWGWPGSVPKSGCRRDPRFRRGLMGTGAGGRLGGGPPLGFCPRR